MYQRLSISVSNDTIEAPTGYKYEFDDCHSYPLLIIDRGSYLGQSIIDTAITVSLDDLTEGIHNLQIGQFSSLSYDLFFTINRNHDYHRVTMADSKLIPGSRDYKIKRKGQILIQSDVWIGHSCHIKDGVIIHNGALIASNSNVVKDVPPYAIVGGNPARLLGYRFDNDIVKKLLMIKWWDWSNEKIIENNEWFNKDIEAFCNQFYDEALEEYLKLDKIDVPRLKSNYLFFADLLDPYKLWDKVIREFVNTFCEDSDSLLIVYIDEELASKNNKLVEDFNEYVVSILINKNAKCTVTLCVESKKNERAIFKSADYFITNRSYSTVRHSCYADENNVKIISGVDVPIFGG